MGAWAVLHDEAFAPAGRTSPFHIFPQGVALPWAMCSLPFQGVHPHHQPNHFALTLFRPFRPFRG